MTHETFPGEKSPQDACGVFGVWASDEEVARLTYFGLYALQHRGQQSAGIATSDGEKILIYKDLGLVSQVFDESSLSTLTGHIALGHARYAKVGAATWENAQPTLGPAAGGTVAVAHNGNITNTRELMAMVHDRHGTDLTGELGRGSSSDTAIITALLRGDDDDPSPSLIRNALAILPQIDGAFSLAFIDETTLYAARDRFGLRPLVLGRLASGWAVASETAALDIVGATFVREIEPGEMLAVDEQGVRSFRFADPTPAGCIFEYVYLARPDTRIAGRNVNAARGEMGRRLAREHPVEADLVIPTPDSGTPAAIGYAQESGIPFAQGVVKNAYVGRTFIQPTETIRQLGIRLKLNPMREVIAGKRLVVVDDSIVRGNTQRALVRMLREAGAAEVHVRISSPPVKWPCFFGIDFATRAELIANGLGVEQIRANIEADSLGYISLAGMVEATAIPEERLCTACFTGNYPTPVPLGPSGEETAHAVEI
ncbi:MAG TPA: amidophosphoribosyltransferase [Actinomycetaceae bacterium]|nr:amidophosphoribosyltransferase [Actinomycetaceae bacterium]